MKKQLLFLLLIIVSITNTSCEEVIDLDLNAAAPRLVIDAALKWEKGTTGQNQMIKLTTTTGYFDTTIPPVSGAVVQVKNGSNTVFEFNELIENSGEYVCSNFVPVLNETYVLTVIVNGTTYTATEKLTAAPVIDKVEQKNDTGFSGEDIEIKFFYTDNGLTNDFYLFRTKLSSYTVPEYSVSRDEFYQGNQLFSIYSNEDIKKGDNVNFTLNGISEGYFNYLQVLLSIAGSSSGGGPFQSPPATVRGNIVNISNVDNYALGFFSASETTSINYEVK